MKREKQTRGRGKDSLVLGWIKIQVAGMGTEANLCQNEGGVWRKKARTCQRGGVKKRLLNVVAVGGEGKRTLLGGRKKRYL